MSKTPPKEEQIQNWTMFGSKNVLIELHKYNNTEGEIYNSCLSFWLDDNDESSEKNISIITDIWNECPHCCIVQTANNIRNMFNNIADSVIVIDSEGLCLDEEYSLNEMMPEEVELDEYYMPLPEEFNPTVH
jgi:hypothetical protein